MTGFKATVRAWTGDNRQNCAPTRWGEREVEPLLLTHLWLAAHQTADSLQDTSYIIAGLPIAI